MNYYAILSPYLSYEFLLFWFLASAGCVALAQFAILLRLCFRCCPCCGCFKRRPAGCGAIANPVYDSDGPRITVPAIALRDVQFTVQIPTAAARSPVAVKAPCVSSALSVVVEEVMPAIEDVSRRVVKKHKKSKGAESHRTELSYSELLSKMIGDMTTATNRATDAVNASSLAAVAVPLSVKSETSAESDGLHNPFAENKV
jgi:hypothetical protein